MPLQLLNLGVIIPRVFFRLLVTRTPRGKHTGIINSLLQLFKLFNRFYRTERTSSDQLRHCVSPGYLDFRDYTPV